jgi:hypothetical protein
VSEAWQERAQAPAEQTSPGAHATPQPPQFWLSLWTFAQEPSHSASPEGQLVSHAPAAQTSPGAQALPQAPQFAASAPVSTQAPPHSTWPAEHETGTLGSSPPHAAVSSATSIRSRSAA